ncbi:DNA -binding domain-containing protein [Caulobacter sp. KR2-114]|uniref:DNA -binding domain-containing protein n=1 Tax=Caulobacter sp. KR2-114 TaxID=3400912 RepID=UPI003C091679
MATSDGLAGHDSPGGGRGRDPARLSAADYAWEFLRRNPDYVADFANGGGAADIDPRWGLRFGTDPQDAAPDAEVFWRPEVAPGFVVPLVAGGEGQGAPRRPLRAVGGVRHAEDGRHLRLANGLQLFLRGEARPDGPLVVVLAFDRDYGLRVRAADALHRRAGPSGGGMSALRRRRLAQALRALDGARGGASYRAIAKSLFGEAVVEGEPWKTASVRDATIRLVRFGERMMRGDYLTLLRRRG